MDVWYYNITVIMSAMASQITSLTIVYSIVYSGTDQRKHQSTASLAFVRGIHRWPVNSSHKRPVTRKMFPFDDVIMHLFDKFIGVTLKYVPWCYLQLNVALVVSLCYGNIIWFLSVWCSELCFTGYMSIYLQFRSSLWYRCDELSVSCFEALLDDWWFIQGCC